MRRISSVCLIFAGVVSAQTSDPVALVNRAIETLSKLKKFEIRGTMTTENIRGTYETSSKSKFLMAAEAPGKSRLETNEPGGQTVISDGANTWTYQPGQKQYTKTSGSMPDGPPVGSVRTPLANLRHFGSARVVGEEDLELLDGTHKAVVLEVSFGTLPPGPREPQRQKLWIDRSSEIPLKVAMEFTNDRGGELIITSTSMTMESVNLAPVFDAKMFVFTPPVDARLVERIGPNPAPPAPPSDLVDKRAPDFTLTDLSGNEVRLDSYRGKTVLLDFWATWCGPCKAEMPLLERLHREHPNVVILGINVGEDRTLVKKFVDENAMPYQILLAGRDRVQSDYHAEGIPTTVVIDKDGRVRDYRVGYMPATTDPQLSAALRDAVKPFVSPIATPTPVVAAGDAGPAADKVVRAGGNVTTPVVTHKVEPVYTDDAKRARVAGNVVLSTVISTEGEATQIQVVSGLGHGLDEKATEALRRWRFEPGRKDGKPVAVASTVEFRFTPPAAPATSPRGAILIDETEPGTAEEAYRRAFHLNQLGHPERAIEMMGKAIQLRPDWAEAFAARARVHYAQKDYRQAIRDFSEALEIDPGSASWLDTRGLAYSYSGEHEKALADYTRAIELSPKTGAYWNNRGWAYSETGFPEKGIGDLTMALKFAPENLKALENRGNTYIRLQDWKQAIADFTAAIELSPTAWQYGRRALAKRSAGDIAGAQEDDARARQMNLESAVH
jgi:TonB family protein